MRLPQRDPTEIMLHVGFACLTAGAWMAWGHAIALFTFGASVVFLVPTRLILKTLREVVRCLRSTS